MQIPRDGGHPGAGLKGVWGGRGGGRDGGNRVGVSIRSMNEWRFRYTVCRFQVFWEAGSSPILL